RHSGRAGDLLNRGDSGIFGVAWWLVWWSKDAGQYQRDYALAAKSAGTAYFALIHWNLTKNGTQPPAPVIARKTVALNQDAGGIDNGRQWWWWQRGSRCRPGDFFNRSGGRVLFLAWRAVRGQEHQS